MSCCPETEHARVPSACKILLTIGPKQKRARSSSWLLQRATSRSAPSLVAGGFFAIWMQKSCRERVAAPDIQISGLGRGQRRVRAVAAVEDRAAVKTVEPVPRIALTQQEACASLGCSEEFFVEHVRPYLRVVRRGRKRLFPVPRQPHEHREAAPHRRRDANVARLRAHLGRSRRAHRQARMRRALWTRCSRGRYAGGL
jgi:hypothetical protein